MLRLAFVVFRRVSTRHRIAGVEVLEIGSLPGAPRYLADLAEALERLQGDSRRWRLVRKHIPYIVLSEHGGGRFIPALRLCVLGTATFRSGPYYTAGVIVHEMTHARLFACGFTYSAETQEREEALCVRETLRFLNQTSEGRSVAQTYATQAAQAFAEREPWYTERRRLQYGSNAMDFYGLPKWLQSVRRIILGRH